MYLDPFLALSVSINTKVVHIQSSTKSGMRLCLVSASCLNARGSRRSSLYPFVWFTASPCKARCSLAQIYCLSFMYQGAVLGKNNRCSLVDSIKWEITLRNVLHLTKMLKESVEWLSCRRSFNPWRKKGKCPMLCLEIAEVQMVLKASSLT